MCVFLCVQSMSQLLADHRSMAEYLIADAAAVQRLRSAGMFNFPMQLM